MRALPPNFHSHEYGGIDPPPLLLMRPAYVLLPFIRAPIGFEHVRLLTIMRTMLWLIIGPPVVELLYIGPPVVELLYIGFTGALLRRNLGHRYLVFFALAYVVAALAVYIRGVGAWIG
jgi:hypothetical protein